MINEDYLRSLGFRGFEHLQKSLLDGKERLVNVVPFENDLLVIRLIKEREKWIVEKLLLENNDNKLQDFFPIGVTLEELIDKLFKNS